MTADKAEALRVLAADLRTPENEARNAALIYVREGGKLTIPVVLVGSSIEALKSQLGEAEAERDKWKKRALDAETTNSAILDLADRIRRERSDAPPPAPKWTVNAGWRPA